MNYGRAVMAGVAATIVYFLMGFLMFGLSPLRKEYERFPNIYRTQDAMKKVAPIGMLGMLMSMIVLAILYGATVPMGGGIAAGLRFGVLIALFSLGTFVIHNHVNLNISARLTIGQGVAYFIQWIIVGVVISLLYH